MNILNTNSLFGQKFFRFSDLQPLNTERYFSCLNLMKPLFKREDFKNSTPGFYINYITKNPLITENVKDIVQDESLSEEQKSILLNKILEINNKEKCPALTTEKLNEIFADKNFTNLNSLNSDSGYITCSFVPDETQDPDMHNIQITINPWSDSESAKKEHQKSRSFFAEFNDTSIELNDLNNLGDGAYGFKDKNSSAIYLINSSNTINISIEKYESTTFKKDYTSELTQVAEELLNPTAAEKVNR